MREFTKDRNETDITINKTSFFYFDLLDGPGLGADNRLRRPPHSRARVPAKSAESHTLLLNVFF